MNIIVDEMNHIPETQLVGGLADIAEDLAVVAAVDRIKQNPVGQSVDRPDKKENPAPRDSR